MKINLARVVGIGCLLIGWGLTKPNVILFGIGILSGELLRYMDAMLVEVEE